MVSRMMVVSIGIGVLKANDPSTLFEFGSHITLTVDWARGILQSVDWLRQKRITGKIEPSPNS